MVFWCIKLLRPDISCDLSPILLSNDIGSDIEPKATWLLINYQATIVIMMQGSCDHTMFCGSARDNKYRTIILIWGLMFWVVSSTQ